MSKWDNSIHEDKEQLKRIEAAQKAETTPAEICHESKSAKFKGSGKDMYITTLDSCTCMDFSRRRLPCKHIYRLTLELEGIEVERGVNKNEQNQLPCEILSLPIPCQKILYKMSYESAYRNKGIIVFRRNKFSEELCQINFCIQHVIDIETISMLECREIKQLLFSIDIAELPKNNSQKKTFMKYIEENLELVIPLIENEFVFLEFNENIERLKHVIFRRCSKIFDEEGIRDEILYRM